MTRGFVILSGLALFGLQYFLLLKTSRRWLLWSPFGYVILLLLLAACTLLFHWGDGGWLDLSALFALLLTAYAGFCALSLALARLLFRLRHRKNPSA